MGARNGIKYAVAPSGSLVGRNCARILSGICQRFPSGTLYTGLLQATFRAVRYEYHLTDDEYLELMTVFVQEPSL